MAENSFADMMSGQSDTTLLAVIHDQAHYDPALVEAARNELRRRQIAYDEQMLTSPILPGRKGSPPSVPTRLRTRLGNIGHQLNPFQYEGVQRDLAMIFVSLSYYLLFLIITGYGDILDALARFSFSKSFFVSLLPYIILPIGLYLFHRRQRSGWLVLSSWIAYSALGLIPLGWRLLHHQEALFLTQPANASSLLIGLLIFGGTFYALARRSIRHALLIPVYGPILAAVLGGALLWLSL